MAGSSGSDQREALGAGMPHESAELARGRRRMVLGGLAASLLMGAFGASPASAAAPPIDYGALGATGGGLEEGQTVDGDVDADQPGDAPTSSSPTDESAPEASSDNPAAAEQTADPQVPASPPPAAAPVAPAPPPPAAASARPAATPAVTAAVEPAPAPAAPVGAASPPEETAQPATAPASPPPTLPKTELPESAAASGPSDAKVTTRIQRSAIGDERHARRTARANSLRTDEPPRGETSSIQDDWPIASPASQDSAGAGAPAAEPEAAELETAVAQDEAAPRRLSGDFAGARSTRADSGRTVVVRNGDSLWSIAERHLGPRATEEDIAQFVQQLWDLNAARIASGDPSSLTPGTALRIPRKDR